MDKKTNKQNSENGKLDMVHDPMPWYPAMSAWFEGRTKEVICPLCGGTITVYAQRVLGEWGYGLFTCNKCGKTAHLCRARIPEHLCTAESLEFQK